MQCKKNKLTFTRIKEIALKDKAIQARNYPDAIKSNWVTLYPNNQVVGEVH